MCRPCTPGGIGRSLSTSSPPAFVSSTVTVPTGRPRKLVNCAWAAGGTTRAALGLPPQAASATAVTATPTGTNPGFTERSLAREERKLHAGGGPGDGLGGWAGCGAQADPEAPDERG